jgi:Leucine-rich repeat (LRR) protein
MINLLYLLSVVPAEDWYRNWPASRTFMMRRTSKELKKAMDKIHPPVNIRFIKVFKELSPDWYLIYRIRKLELLACSMSGENKNKLVRLLGQCPALVKLKIVGNYNFGSVVTKSIEQVLPQCPLLKHLNLSGNTIEDAGAESLARILGLFPLLKHLDLSWNNIGSKGVESLAGVLGQCTALTHLDLNNNNIGLDGVKVLLQCDTLNSVVIG